MEPDLIQNSIHSIRDEQNHPNIIRLRLTDQIKELQTVLRDKCQKKPTTLVPFAAGFQSPPPSPKSAQNLSQMVATGTRWATGRSDFIFYADRLIRLVVEEGLNQLPYQKHIITTPTGCKYEGLRYMKGNCGVSIMRSGEAMEKGLRDCCRSIRIGKILIQSDEDTHEAKVFYAKFPPDIHQRKVLLMYPILSTGNTVIKAVDVLKQHSVDEDNIIVLNLFCTPQGVQSVMKKYPGLKILTSEVHPMAPNHFGQKYFGTD